MRRALSCLALAALLAALAGVPLGCGDHATDPTVNPQAYVGTWEVQIAAAPQCWPAATLLFTVDADDAAAAGAEFINVVSDWRFPSSAGPVGLTTGHVNWHDDAFGFRFHKSGGAKGWFDGRGSSPRRLEGTFSDPEFAFRTTVSNGPCAAAAVATHR